MDMSLRRRALAIAITLFALATLVGATLISQSPAQTGPSLDVAETNAELAEERLGMRENARARAASQRLLERSGEVVNAPVTYGLDLMNGFEGEVRFGKGNDWEPAIAASPNTGAAYVLTTRFGSELCGKCPRPSIVMRTSADGGSTWGGTTYLCKCGSTAQYDPQIEVDNTGRVHATWLDFRPGNNWATLYVRSDDGGVTWTDPIDVVPPLGWSDHGFLTISQDGQDVYVGFNRAASFVSTSHDGGNTFSDPVRTSPEGENRYYFHYDGVVDENGDVFIAATAVTKTPYARGKVRYYALHSADGGATWDQIHIATVSEQPDCLNLGCGRDHFSGLSSMGGDQNGNLVYGYVGTDTARKGQTMRVRTSSDNGATWTPAVELSPTFKGNRRVIAAFPAVEAAGTDDFRVIWMDDRKGKKNWNTWHTQSSDGGDTWSDEVRISDASGGAGYKDKGGYHADYGDYLELAVNNDGESLGAWGEAYSYWGPGGTWMNVQEP